MRIQYESRRVAEDDRLRSLYMQELIQAEYTLDPQFGNVTIPKVLIQFWHDLAALPADVRECLESWAPLTACGLPTTAQAGQIPAEAGVKRMVLTHLSASVNQDEALAEVGQHYQGEVLFGEDLLVIE